ncbi:MAG: phage tail protein [Armatimonadetes bacterium]|nr:phage tail protein [Armatimonadota bacterium]
MGYSYPLQHKDTFTVEIDGITVAEFRMCSEIKATAATLSQRSGGTRRSHKEPGAITDEPITLTRSHGHGRELYDWWLQTMDYRKGVGVPLSQLKKDLDIVDWHIDGTEARRWHVHGAFISSYSAGDRDNNADEFADEIVILEHDGAELVTD